MESNSESEKEKEDKFSFIKKKPKLEFHIKKDSKTPKKVNFKLKREPKKSTQDYLEILKKLNTLLNSHSISEAQRRDYCKSQRYFMKLYLDHISGD